MKAIDSALSFIAPHHCLSCQVEGSVCCQKCLASLRLKHAYSVCYSCQLKVKTKSGVCLGCQRESYFGGVFWFSDYQEELSKSLIKALKFNNMRAASGVMAEGIWHCLPKEIRQSVDYICAVPTANKRVRQRGWDQATLIATCLAKDQKIPRKTFLLRSSSFDQIGATKQERMEASKKFFTPIRRSLFKSKTVLLVDDVLTTGATLNSAARTLKSAGAKEVYAVTFARQSLVKQKTQQ